MTRPSALLDAAMTPQMVGRAFDDARRTVNLWRANPQPERDRIRLQMGRSLNCRPKWHVILQSIVRRLLADETARAG